MGLSPEDFDAAFGDTVLRRFPGAWTLFGGQAREGTGGADGGGHDQRDHGEHGGHGGRTAAGLGERADTSNPDSRKGEDGAAAQRPVGLVLAFFAHPDPALAPYMILGGIFFFPWASCRQRVEAAVGFFNDARREVPMLHYARAQDRRFFEMICRHGIMRRVGTSHSVNPDGPAVVFETRGV